MLETAKVALWAEHNFPFGNKPLFQARTSINLPAWEDAMLLTLAASACTATAAILLVHFVLRLLPELIEDVRRRFDG